MKKTTEESKQGFRSYDHNASPKLPKYDNDKAGRGQGYHTLHDLLMANLMRCDETLEVIFKEIAQSEKNGR